MFINARRWELSSRNICQQMDFRQSAATLLDEETKVQWKINKLIIIPSD